MSTRIAFLTTLGLLITLAVARGAQPALLAGLVDPVLGLDHFIVLLAAGTWAGRLTGAAQWHLPVAFLGGMIFGYLLGLGPPPTPELVYLLHVLAVAPVFLLAFGIATAARLPPAEMFSTIAALGACHGLLHTMHGQAAGIEPTSLDALWFGLGALGSATALLMAGLGVGRTLKSSG